MRYLSSMVNLNAATTLLLTASLYICYKEHSRRI